MKQEADYGTTMKKPYAHYCQDTSSWKTLQLSVIEDSELCLGAWPRSGTMLGGIVYQQHPLAPLTGATAYSLSQLAPTLHHLFQESATTQWASAPATNPSGNRQAQYTRLPESLQEEVPATSSGCCAGWWRTEPDVGRVAHGIPRRVDRLRCLGNAVVPQVAEYIGRMVVAHHEAQRMADITNPREGAHMNTGTTLTLDAEENDDA